jgi:hypothetical protein
MPSKTPRAPAALATLPRPAEVLVRHVCVLLNNLDRAVQAGAGEPLSPRKERERYIWLLRHLSIFIRAIGTREQANILSDLALALADLDNGIKAPLLKATTFNAQSSKTWRARANVAAGIVALLRLGMTRDDAAKYALENYPRIDRLVGKKSEDPRQAVLSWYDEFTGKRSNRRMKNSVAIDVFSVTTEILATLPEHSNIQKVADRCFQIASRS